jgi:hypothetical protein
MFTHVHCWNFDCDAAGPEHDTEPEAIAAWNRVAAMPGLLRDVHLYSERMEVEEHLYTSGPESEWARRRDVAQRVPPDKNPEENGITPNPKNPR